MLREFQDEIEKLKNKLAGRGAIPSGMTEEEILELKKKEIEEAKHQTEEEKTKLLKEAKKKAKGSQQFLQNLESEKIVLNWQLGGYLLMYGKR